MITVSNVSLNFSGTSLFKDVNLKFTPERRKAAAPEREFRSGRAAC